MAHHFALKIGQLTSRLMRADDNLSLLLAAPSESKELEESMPEFRRNIRRVVQGKVTRTFSTEVEKLLEASCLLKPGGLYEIEVQRVIQACTEFLQSDSMDCSSPSKSSSSSSDGSSGPMDFDVEKVKVPTRMGVPPTGGSATD